MRKYLVWFFVLVMVAAIGFSACSKKEEAPAPVEQSAPVEVQAPPEPADNTAAPAEQAPAAPAEQAPAK